MTILQAGNLTLQDVQGLLGFVRQYDGSFTPWLSLEPVTDFERQELLQTRADFDNHLLSGTASEGQVKLVVISPLLRLAGFFRHPMKIRVEEGIARIEIVDEETTITGRFDILAINQARQAADDVPFWVLVVESKNSEAAASTGLPQLLTYAYRSLKYQSAVWGLTTNGEIYRFVRISAGNPPTYQLMPILSLTELESLVKLLQVLKAICHSQQAIASDLEKP